VFNNIFFDTLGRHSFQKEAKGRCQEGESCSSGSEEEKEMKGARRGT